MFNNFRFQKRWGQNFLIDQNIARKIIDVSMLSKTDSVLEIGPGNGFLTDFLLEKADNVTAIEIDKKLFAFLSDKFKHEKRIVLIREDALKINWETLQKKPNKIVANIPYYITAPLIFKAIKELPECGTIVFMMQKEVADRITAKYNNKIYGALSITVQTVWDVENCFVVSRNVFKPKPKVESSVVKCAPKKNCALEKNDINSFSTFVKKMFSKRRKVLSGIILKEYNINKDILYQFWREKNIDNLARPENIKVSLWTDLYKFLKNNDCFKVKG